MNSSKNNYNADKTSIDSLIETLNSKDGLARQHARLALVKIGEPALPALIKAFEKKDDIMHWEVAKALSQIGSSKAAEILVKTLEDNEFSVRWIATEGLIYIGDDALGPLLRIPAHSGHPFRFYPDTHSDSFRTPIPIESGQRFLNISHSRPGAFRFSQIGYISIAG